MSNRHNISEDEQTAKVEQLRAAVEDIISPEFDTHYNLLRWLQFDDFNVEKAIEPLRNHLELRKLRKLDEKKTRLQECPIAEQYAPLSVIGLNRKDGDRVVVVEQGGKLDVPGILKSVQPTAYLHDRFRIFEEVLKRINEMEARLGKQCYGYFIADLDGMKFDPTLLPIITGPFRVQWQQINLNYRELFENTIIINAPSYIHVLLAAMAPFIPEHVKSQIKLLGKNYKEELLSIIDADFLPKKYGGNVPDSDVLLDPTPVPKSLHWKEKENSLKEKPLHKVIVPAGKHRILSFFGKADTTLYLYTHLEGNVYISLYYSAKQDTPEEKWREIVPEILNCPLPAIDCFDLDCQRTGYYHLKMKNASSWMFSTTFRITVELENKKEVVPVQIGEKWYRREEER